MAERGPARVAVVGPFSGPRAAWGELLREGAAGPVAPAAGSSAAWEFHDDRGDAATAREVGLRLARDLELVAVIGHFNSLGAHHALPGYRDARLPVVLPLSTKPGLLDGSDGWALRWCPDDLGQLVALRAAVSAAGHTGLEVTDDGSDYGRRLADTVTGLPDDGLTVVRTAIPSAGSAALLVCGTHVGAARTARQAVAAGRTGPLLFPDDCAIGEFAGLLGPAAGQALVARLAGGPAALVQDSFRALGTALADRPEARGRELLAAVRDRAGRRFTPGGEPYGLGPGGGWEVVPVAVLDPAGTGHHAAPAASSPAGTGRHAVPVAPAPAEPAPTTGGHPTAPAGRHAVPAGPTPVPAVSSPVAPGTPPPLYGRMLSANPGTCDLDAVVVGCGAVGSAVAALLAEAGAAVATTEPEAGGPSATRYSGGLVRAYELGPEARALAIRSHQLLWGAASEERQAAGFRRTGSLVLLGPDDLPEAAAGVAELGAAGIPARLLDLGQLRSQHPEIDPAGLAGAVWEPDGGYADPRAFAAVKRRAALARGAVVLPGGAVRAVVAGPSGVVVRTATGTVTAAVVVLAAGAGTSALLPAGYVPPGGPPRTKTIRYAFFDRAGQPVPTVSDLVTGAWGRPQVDGAFGGGFLTGRPVQEWDVRPGGADELPARDIAYIREGVRGRWPWLATAPALGGRWGVDLYPAHGPLLGPLPGTPRLLVAAGWSGAGFKTAPAAAERAAHAALSVLGSRAPV
ncbi:FAD-dependent oxidoreductase [Streptomyces sp. NPDC059452]|uniref:FAD-dependent oxidoreductase n=1 Tax=Streptomyces sp. NPDC059452 TaxID=3346835 RepID=UPI00368E9F7D